MIKRDYFALVNTYKNGSDGQIYSQHSFAYTTKSFLKVNNEELISRIENYALRKSDYKDCGNAVVQNITRI